jgi:hypothetical protein
MLRTGCIQNFTSHLTVPLGLSCHIILTLDDDDDDDDDDDLF